MNKTIALSLHFAKDYLKKILPETILKSEDVDSIFQSASDVLQSDTDLSSYISKIELTNWGSTFATPEPDQYTLKTITEALYNNKKFWVSYQSRNNNDIKKYLINPLALVYCSNVAYLICTLFDGDTIIQLALHRMREPQIAPVPAFTPNGFDLDRYMKSGAFDYPTGDENNKTITLKAILSRDASVYFKERPDSYKKLIDTGDGNVELEAIVHNSLAVRHILRGFGDQIQILEPDYLRDEIHKSALHDALTGLLNRGEFDFRLEYEIKRHTRDSQTFGLLMLDIDHFKNINDTYGHPDGDEVLKELAKRIQTSVRERGGDYCFRYGGEEFAVILVNADLNESIEVAERIRLAVCGNPFSLSKNRINMVTVTVSIGIAIFPKDANDKDRLKKRADKMLYEAKESGRNCVKY